MSHTEIIWIVVTATFASTLGVYVAIRKIKQYTKPPVNTLERRGDIELVDYIEPTQPQQIYQYPDLSEGQPFPWYTYQRPPTYWSETLPSYQTDNFYINSCLENSINIDFILIIFIISVFILFLIIRIKKINLFYCFIKSFIWYAPLTKTYSSFIKRDRR